MRLTGFTVPGRPRGKARHRSSARIVQQDGVPRAVVHQHSDPRTVAAEREIAALYLQATDERRPLAGPVRLTVTAVFPIPQSFRGELRDACLRGLVPCISKPDRDNIEKLVCDALNGLAWVDDSQIVDGPVVKRYGSPPRLEVTVEEVDISRIPAIPAVERREAHMDAPAPAQPRRPAKSKQTKSKLPARLQAAVDRALGKERP